MTNFEILAVSDSLIAIHLAGATSIAKASGFSKTLREQMERYNTPAADKIAQVQAEVDAVREVGLSFAKPY